MLVAAKISGETGGIGRFESDARFPCLAGVPPIDASSGQQRRHRLSRHGNRSSTRRCTRSPFVQGRWDPRARAYLERSQKDGNSCRLARRAVERHLPRVMAHLLQARAGDPPRSVEARGDNVRARVLA